MVQNTVKYSQGADLELKMIILPLVFDSLVMEFGLLLGKIIVYPFVAHNMYFVHNILDTPSSNQMSKFRAEYDN